MSGISLFRLPMSLCRSTEFDLVVATEFEGVIPTKFKLGILNTYLDDKMNPAYPTPIQQYTNIYNQTAVVDENA